MPGTSSARFRGTCSRRDWLLAASAGGLGLALPVSAHSMLAYPTRPITLVVPWPAGGATDITMRVLADVAGRSFGTPMVVENKPGAGGTLVGPALRAAAPDGYTIGQLPLTLYRFPLQQKVSWDPLRDVAPIIQISGVTFGVLVPADSPFQSVPELMAWARWHPGRLTVGSTGVGTTAHLAMEVVAAAEDASYIHVPYKGTSDQMLALAGGILMAGVNSTGFAPYVESGKLRLLAIFSAQRSRRWPAVPTMRELGYRNAVYNSPYGIGAPAATDGAIVRKLHDAFKLAMFDRQHLAELARYDQEPAYLDSADYVAQLRETTQRERLLLARLGIAVGKPE